MHRIYSGIQWSTVAITVILLFVVAVLATLTAAPSSASADHCEASELVIRFVPGFQDYEEAGRDDEGLKGEFCGAMDSEVWARVGDITGSPGCTGPNACTGGLIGAAQALWFNVIDNATLVMCTGPELPPTDSEMCYGFAGRNGLVATGGYFDVVDHLVADPKSVIYGEPDGG